jgi:hypothetical protein
MTALQNETIHEVVEMAFEKSKTVAAFPKKVPIQIYALLLHYLLYL